MYPSVFPLKKRGKAPKFAAMALERAEIPESKSDNYAQLDGLLDEALRAKEVCQENAWG